MSMQFFMKKSIFVAELRVASENLNFLQDKVSDYFFNAIFNSLSDLSAVG